METRADEKGFREILCRFSQNSTCVSITSVETRRTCFFISFRNIPRQEKEKKEFVHFDDQNVNSLCSRHHYVNSSYWFCVSIRKTIFNQSSFGYFKNRISK